MENTMDLVINASVPGAVVVTVNVTESTDLAPVLAAITEVKEEIMTQDNDLLAQLQATNDKLNAITPVLDELADDVNRLADDFDTLKASINQPTPEQQAALDSISTNIDGLQTRLQGVDARVEASDPEPTPEP
jgi:chromosome segregation ATPase